MADELELPNLATESFDTIFQSLREAIPTFSSNWTDYNNSDPGITILQLLAWIAQASYYRIDRLTATSYRNFLLLGAGTPEQGIDAALSAAQRDIAKVDGRPLMLGGENVNLDPQLLNVLTYLQASARRAPDPAELRVQAQAYWTGSFRAVTASDFERLAIACTASVSDDSATEKVMRALATLEGEWIVVTIVSGWRPGFRTVYSPAVDGGDLIASMEIILQAVSYGFFNGYLKLQQAVTAFLAKRRLVGTPLSVRAAKFFFFSAGAQLVPGSGEDPQVVLTAAAAAVTALFDPVTGGPDGDGWPIDRQPTADDVIAALAALPSVDRRQPITATIELLDGTRVGSARVGRTTVVANTQETRGLPLLSSAKIRALDNTWAIEVGVHSRIGVDTRIPFEGQA